MADIEHYLPEVTEPQLRTKELYNIFESLTLIDKRTNQYRTRYDPENETWVWDDEESGIHLSIQHEIAWTGAGQILTVSLVQPPHVPSQMQRRLVVSHFHKMGAYTQDSHTIESVDLIEVTTDKERLRRDATDDDITEFETICSFMEAILLNQERKNKVQFELGRAVPLSEMLGQLETSEETFFKAIDF